MENEEYETIDLLEVLNAVRQHLLAVILTTLILACAGFGVSKFLMTPKYQASALMIVNTRQDTTSNVTSDQINSPPSWSPPTASSSRAIPCCSRSSTIWA